MMLDGCVGLPVTWLRATWNTWPRPAASSISTSARQRSPLSKKVSCRLPKASSVLKFSLLVQEPRRRVVQRAVDRAERVAVHELRHLLDQRARHLDEAAVAEDVDQHEMREQVAAVAESGRQRLLRDVEQAGLGLVAQLPGQLAAGLPLMSPDLVAAREDALQPIVEGVELREQRFCAIRANRQGDRFPFAAARGDGDEALHRPGPRCADLEKCAAPVALAAAPRSQSSGWRRRPGARFCSWSVR